MAKPGDKNVFGMKVVGHDGNMLELVCEHCQGVGYASAAEFNSTRCGSAKCASTQGRNE